MISLFLLSIPFTHFNALHIHPISIVFTACNETNLMHHISSVYSITISLHVMGLLVAHHQGVTMYICRKWYVLYVLVDCQLASGQSTEMYNTYCLLHIYNATS
jgi:hypothetical protein